MDGKIFRLGIPEDALEIVMEKTAGKRFRFPPRQSRHNPLYRKKRNKQICQRVSSGSKIEELVREYKLSARRIEQILIENGIHYHREKRKSLKDEIHLLRKMGYSKAEIARRTGKSRQWVHEIIRKEDK